MRRDLRPYTWLLALPVIALCGWLWGRAAALWTGSFLLVPAHTVVESKSAPQAERKEVDIQEIINRNMFCSFCAPPPPSNGTAEAVDLTPQKSTLPWVLIATMVVPGDPIWTHAVVRDLNDVYKTTHIFRQGNKLPAENTQVVRITQFENQAGEIQGRMYFTHNNRTEYLDTEKTKPGSMLGATAPTAQASNDPLQQEIERGITCTTPTQCEIKRSLVDKLSNNPLSLYSSVALPPNLKDGQANGVIVRFLKPNNLFAKLGMQHLDVLKSINGADISSPDKGLEAYTNLKKASNLTLVIERKGQTITLDYKIR